MNGLRWVGILLGLGLLQVFLPQVWSVFGFVDWLLIAVVHLALRSDFRHAIVLGAVAGLIQDGLSGGIVGLHAFGKTVVAAIIASFGSLVVVRGPAYQGILAAGAGLVDGLIVGAWLALLGRPQTLGPLEVPARALATGAAAAGVLLASRWWQQRMLRRSFSSGRGVRK